MHVSDCHLSPDHPHAMANFEAVVAWLNEEPPALVVNTGNCLRGGPDVVHDQQLQRWMHRHITAPVVAVPGSGDVGDSGPFVRPEHRVTEQRSRQFVEAWGADRFSVDLGQWRLLGIDSQLCGASPQREQQLLDWLGQSLRGATNAVLFMHKPIEHTARSRLWSVLRTGPVHVVASGHRHRSRSSALANGLTAVWAPSTATTSAESFDGSDPRCGVMEYTFDGPTVRWRHIEVPGMVHHALDEQRHTTAQPDAAHHHSSSTPAA